MYRASTLRKVACTAVTAVALCCSPLAGYHAYDGASASDSWDLAPIATPQRRIPESPLSKLEGALGNLQRLSEEQPHKFSPPWIDRAGQLRIGTLRVDTKTSTLATKRAGVPVTLTAVKHTTANLKEQMARAQLSSLPPTLRDAITAIAVDAENNRIVLSLKRVDTATRRIVRSTLGPGVAVLEAPTANPMAGDTSPEISCR